MREYVRSILLRELRTLRREIEAYESDAEIWKTPSGVANSAGALALHLSGNLRHFVGARLGGTGYVRDRPGEFAGGALPREDILREIDAAIADIDAALASLLDDELEARFPDAVPGVNVTTGDFLLHLIAHTGYHLGQIDYHRRLVTGSGETVGAVAVPELHSAESAGAR